MHEPQVKKRDGTLVPFDRERIVRAITKAGQATEEFNATTAHSLTTQALRVIKTRRRTDEVADIERIQDIVEQTLIDSGYIETARAYIVYRNQHQTLRKDKKTLVNVGAAMNEYLEREDWRVSANANQGYSLGGLILNTAGKVTANYWLNHVYSPEIGEAHREGDLHIHDLDLLAPYCAGWSLRTLLNEGFNGVPGKVEAKPPKHMSSAVGQIVNFLGTLQNEWAGAQAFSSFDTYMAPFVRVDDLDYTQVRQYIQELVYNLNVPSRWGSQSPFSNLTLDLVCPEDLADNVPLIGGKEVDFCYGDLQEEMDMINRAYIEVMTAGDAKGRVFTFPIPTYNITPDFDWNTPIADMLFEMTAKYGIPYFQNFLNSDLKPNMVRSMCCRLSLDLTELLKRGNGLFGSAEQTGSLGVVTINCARLGYTMPAGDHSERDYSVFFQQLDKLLDIAKNALEIKRKTIQKYMDNGLFPYTKRYLGTLRNHFSTIGVNGMNEMIENFTYCDFDITTPEGRGFAERVLDHIRARLTEFQDETGHMYNLEATPAEGAGYRFAREDQKRFPDIIQAGTKERPYYTNSSQLPVGYTDDPFKALALQEPLQGKYTGGTVMHLYLGERMTSGDACRELVKRSLEGFRVPYITVTPTFSVCPIHGYIAGDHEYCPKCDSELLAKKEKSDE